MCIRDRYYPDGSTVRHIGSSDTLYRNRMDDGTVRLNRRSGIIPTGGRYRCVIPNNQGDLTTIFAEILSENCKFSIHMDNKCFNLLYWSIAIPSIVNHPQHIFNIDPGSTISLSIVAHNTRTYQWQVNDTDVNDSSKYQGTRTSTLVIHGIQEQDEGFFSCIVSNEFLSRISDAAAVTVCKSYLKQ